MRRLFHFAAGITGPATLTMLALALSLATRTETVMAQEEIPAEVALEEPSGDHPRYIGLVCRPVEPALASQLGLAEDEGLLIHEVLPDSPADAAGLRVHDVIVELNGTPVESLAQLAAAVRADAESDDAPALKLTILRHGDREELEIVPAARPDDLPRRGPALPPGSEADDGSITDLLRRMMPRGERMRFPRDLTFYIPGVTGPVEFPEDLHLSIEKHGNEPGRIVVEKGDERWEVTEDSLSELPRELRRVVAAYLGRLPDRAIRVGERARDSIAPYVDQLPDEARGRLEEMLRRLEQAGDAAAEATDGVRERELDRLNRQLERLQRAIDSIEQRLSPDAEEPTEEVTPSESDSEA